MLLTHRALHSSPKLFVYTLPQSLSTALKPFVFLCALLSASLVFSWFAFSYAFSANSFLVASSSWNVKHVLLPFKMRFTPQSVCIREYACLRTYLLQGFFSSMTGNHAAFHRSMVRMHTCLPVSAHVCITVFPEASTVLILPRTSSEVLFQTFFAERLRRGGRPSFVLLTQVVIVFLATPRIHEASRIEQTPRITLSVTLLTNSSSYFIGEPTSLFIVYPNKERSGGNKKVPPLCLI